MFLGMTKESSLLAGIGRLIGVLIVLTAKVLALRSGLSLAQKVGCNQIVINSDDMEVIDTMKNEGRSAGVAAAILDDCYFLACDFSLASFEHCNRKANKVAHELARLAKLSASRD